MTNKTIGLFLLATTFLSSPAGAAALTPTPDTIKSEAADLIGNFALSELTGDLPAGAVEVMIGDKSYYFMPSGENTALLATLAGTPAGNLKEDANGIFELNSQKYGFDVASIPDSVFEYAEGTKDDYNFTVQEADAEGNLTDKYYKINLKPENFSTSKSITWTEVSEAQKDDKDDDLSDGKVSAVIAVNLPNDQTKYFQYTYTKPDGRIIYSTRQVNFTGDVIDADFIGNFLSANYPAGGAIYNTGIRNKINGNFISNYLIGNGIQGGAIYNIGTIENITGNFVGNYAASTGNFAYGGAIYNDRATIGSINANFADNYTSLGHSWGGGIANSGIISSIAGNFISNHTTSNGGAIFNGSIFDGPDVAINNVYGDFINNYVASSSSGDDVASGGAIFNGSVFGGFSNVKIGSIIGDFIGNHVSSVIYSFYGGAIFNGTTKFDYTTSNGYASLGDITGNFIANYAVSVNDSAYGGAISNYGYAQYSSLGNITGSFIKNYAVSDSKSAFGGAIYNGIKDKGSVALGYVSGNFLNNYVQTKSITQLAYGGAVYTEGNMTFAAGEQKTYFMSGNYTLGRSYNKRYNAIFVETGASGEVPVITFDTAGGGAWVINDNIEGGKNSNNVINYATRYNLAFTGDGVLNENGLTDQYISINNDIINAGEVAVEGATLRFGAYQHEDKTANNWDGHGRFLAALKADGTADLDAEAVTSLSLNNAAFDLYNEYQDMVNLKGWKAAGDSFLHVDVDVENLTADMLNINGNVEGTTKLVLYPTSDKDIRGESILFAQSTNDTKGSADSFKVWRVYRSPYMFETKYTKTGENANKWELEMNDTANDYAGVEPDECPDPEVPDVKPTPTPDKPTNPVYGEVVAYGALPAAAIEQTRSVVDNVFGQTAGRRSYCPGCGFYDYYWNGEGFRNLWINPTYYTSNIDSPFDVDADVWGIEAGGDLQHDLNNKLGLFVSYRKGSYDMNGDGKHYYSTVGSEIDIDSYLAGLYYRYDRNNWYAFATLYGGIQQADIKTDDGIKSDTDGVEFGASLEAGYDYNLTDTVYLTPSLGVFYTQVNYDDATDSVGKKAEYNDLKQIELEAGVKLTKAFRLDEGYANVYVKPSVVQTIVDGDEVNITGLGKTSTLDDETLGRIEFGGRYGFTDNLSAYGWANYTFGSDYDATTVGLGLNYAF